MLFQGALVAAHQVHLIAQPPPGNGNQLPALIGQEAVQLGQLFQEFRFLQNALTDLTVVVHGIRRILIGTGQKQRVQLGLGWGNGNDLDDIFLIFPDGGTAADAVVFAHGLPHGKAVKQGGDESGFGHGYRLLLASGGGEQWGFRGADHRQTHLCPRADAYPSIIMELSKKSNTFVVVIPRNPWYNVCQY